MVICTCVYCRTKTVTVNGVVQPGCEVSGHTRKNHERNAANVFPPAVKPKAPLSSVPDNNTKKVEGIAKVLCFVYCNY